MTGTSAFSAQVSRLTRGERVLSGLRELRALDEVLDGLCGRAAAATDLDWVLASRVRDGVWSPWRMHVTGGAPAGPLPEIAADLSQLPDEAAVWAHGRPATIHAPRFTAPLPPALRRRLDSGHVIAPIVIGRERLGLLHAGRDRGEVDDEARDGLARFASGAGRVIARADLRRRVDAQDALVADTAADAVAITAANRGRVELQRLAGQTAQPPDDGDAEPPPARPIASGGRLTAREREVLALVAIGLGNRAIAERLAVSPATIKSHVRSMMRKLGVAGRTELIVFAHDAPA